MDGDLLKTEYTGETIEAASWTVIKSTEVEDDILFVEIFVPEYNITGYWELYVEGNEVTGYAFDRFDIVQIITRKNKKIIFILLFFLINSCSSLRIN